MDRYVRDEELIAEAIKATRRSAREANRPTGTEKARTTEVALEAWDQSVFAKDLAEQLETELGPLPGQIQSALDDAAAALSEAGLARSDAASAVADAQQAVADAAQAIQDAADAAEDAAEADGKAVAAQAAAGAAQDAAADALAAAGVDRVVVGGVPPRANLAPAIVGDGTWAEVRRNRHRVPRATTTYWRDLVSGQGTTGTSVSRLLTGAGPGGADVLEAEVTQALDGNKQLRINTIASGGTTQLSPVTAGEIVEGSLDLTADRPGGAGIDMRILVAFFGPTGAWINETVSGYVSVGTDPANPNRMSVIATAPAGASFAQVVAVGPSGVGPVGMKIRASRAYLGAPGAYFDGSSMDTTMPQPEDFRVRWLGTPNASESVMEIERVAGLTGAGCVAGVSSRAGKPAARLIATAPVTNTYTYASIAVPADIRNLGTAVGTSHLDTPLVGAGLNPKLATLRSRNPDPSAPVPNVAGTYPQRIVFGPLTDQFRIELMHGGAQGSGDVWWTDIGLYAGDYDGPNLDMSKVLWIDTTAGNNTPKRWETNTWTPITDKVAADAAIAAANAQTKANQAFDDAAAAAIAAGNAQTAANGKNTVWYQATAPAGTGHKTNDVWFNTGDGNKMSRWNGSTWTTSAFGTAAIANLAITDALIANLDAAKITTGELDAARIAALSITTGKLAASAVTVEKLAALAVTAEKIAANAVTAVKIAANAVTAEKINAGAVTTDKLDASAVTAEKLAAGSVIAEKIAALAITAEKIAVNALDAMTIRGAQIYGGYIEAPVIASSDKLGTGANVLNDPSFQSGIDTAWVASGHLGDAATTQTDTITWDRTFTQQTFQGSTFSRRLQGSGTAVLSLTPAERKTGSIAFANYSWKPSNRTLNNQFTYPNPSTTERYFKFGDLDPSWACAAPPLGAGTARTTYLTNSAVVPVSSGDRWNIRFEFLRLRSVHIPYVNLRIEVVNSSTSAVLFSYDLSDSELLAGSVNTWFEATSSASVRLRMRAVYTAAGGSALRKLNVGAFARDYHNGVLSSTWTSTASNGYLPYKDSSESSGLPVTYDYGTVGYGEMHYRSNLQVTLNTAVFAKVQPEKGWRLTGENGLELFNDIGARTGLLNGESNYLNGTFGTRESGTRAVMEDSRHAVTNTAGNIVGSFSSNGTQSYISVNNISGPTSTLPLRVGDPIGLVEFVGPVSFQGDTDWTTVTVHAPWVHETGNPLQYRVLRGTLEFKGRVSGSTADSFIGSLPAAIADRIDGNTFAWGYRQGVMSGIQVRTDGKIQHLTTLNGGGAGLQLDISAAKVLLT